MLLLSLRPVCKKMGKGTCVPRVTLDQLKAREDIADFESRGVWSIRTVGAVRADAGAQIVADGTRSGFLRIRGAHGVAPPDNASFGLQNHGEDLSGAHKVREFSEKRAFLVDRIKSAGFFFGEAHGFDRYDFETRFMDAGQNVTLLPPTYRIRLHNCNCTFQSHKNLPDE